jgi:hypothetical protein
LKSTHKEGVPLAHSFFVQECLDPASAEINLIDYIAKTVEDAYNEGTLSQSLLSFYSKTVVQVVEKATAEQLDKFVLRTLFPYLFRALESRDANYKVFHTNTKHSRC